MNQSVSYSTFQSPVSQDFQQPSTRRLVVSHAFPRMAAAEYVRTRHTSMAAAGSVSGRPPPGCKLRIEREIHCGIGVQQRRIEGRKIDVLRSDQAPDLGTTEDDAIGARRLSTCNDIEISPLGIVAHHALAQFVEDNVVDDAAVGGL